MLQNLDITVDRKLKLWQINNVKMVVFWVTFDHIVAQCANKTSYDSLSNLKKLLKWKNFMPKKHYTYLSITHFLCLNPVNLWNCEGL